MSVVILAGAIILLIAVAFSFRERDKKVLIPVRRQIRRPEPRRTPDS